MYLLQNLLIFFNIRLEKYSIVSSSQLGSIQ